jgi:hypothetical protein
LKQVTNWSLLALLHLCYAILTQLILGPGEAKGEFNKRIKSKKLRGVTVELETADKMTDRQLAAKVREHFATASASKSVDPKKTAKKKKMVKTTSGKSTKKTKK